jgi:hypothetical protein
VTQGTLFASPRTVRCYYGCGGQAILGPERYNDRGTCMNQTATCESCGKVAEVSHNLTIRVPKAERVQVSA